MIEISLRLWGYGFTALIKFRRIVKCQKKKLRKK